MNSKTVTGSCLCRALQFSCQLPSLWSAHCHCTLCRRAHGAAFVTWVGFDENGFRLTAGDTLEWYASSSDSERGFCRTCGTTLLFRSERWPGQVHVARSNFDSDLDREPAAHAYWDTHVNWLEINDGLPRNSN